MLFFALITLLLLGHPPGAGPQVVSVVCTPGIDNADVLQQRLDALDRNDGGRLELAGRCTIGRSLVVRANHVEIRGAGWGTSLVQTDRLADILVVRATAGFVLRDLTLMPGDLANASGAGANIAGPDAATAHQFALIDHIHCYALDRCIDLAAAYYSTISNSQIDNSRRAGIWIQGTAGSAGGDNQIVGNTFTCGFPGCHLWAAITHTGGSGLRVVNNKVLGGNVAYHMHARTEANTIIVSGNSFENQTYGPIQIYADDELRKGVGTVQIQNNQLDWWYTERVAAIDVSGVDNEVLITNNLIKMYPTQVGIRVDRVINALVSGNNLSTLGTGGFGVVIGPQARGVKVHGQHYFGAFSQTVWTDATLEPGSETK